MWVRKRRTATGGVKCRESAWVSRAGCAVGLSLSLALTGTGVALAEPASSVPIESGGITIGVGGTGDFGATSIPLNFWATIVPRGDTFVPIIYPGRISLSTLPIFVLSQSESFGRALLAHELQTLPADTKTTVIAMSQGSSITDVLRVGMTKTEDSPDYRFILLGNPRRPNGGVQARFGALDIGSLRVPLAPLGAMIGLPLGRPDRTDSDFQTTDIANTYDPVADFPNYANPIAIANALAGAAFEHIFPGYILEDPAAPNRVETTVGNTSYLTLPSRDLPLLYPFREIAALSGNQKYVDAIDPVLRVLVEAGYNRTADPSQTTYFQVITPQEKIDEMMRALPGAFQQALAVLGGAPRQTPTLPSPDRPSTGPTIEAMTPATNDPIHDTQTLALPDPTDPFMIAVGRILTGDFGKDWGGPIGLAVGGDLGKIAGYAVGAKTVVDSLIQHGTSPAAVDQALVTGDTVVSASAMLGSGVGRAVGTAIGNGIAPALAAATETFTETGNLPAAVDTALRTAPAVIQPVLDAALADPNVGATLQNSLTQFNNLAAPILGIPPVTLPASAEIVGALGTA